MILIARPRLAGKTTELVHKCIREYGVLLVKSSEEKERIIAHFKKDGLDPNRIFTWREWAENRGYTFPPETPLMIDNVDWFIQEQFKRWRTVAVSFTMGGNVDWGERMNIEKPDDKTEFKKFYLGDWGDDESVNK